MSERPLKTRIKNKHDIESNWKLATNFVPLNGEIIIYDEDDTHIYKRLKIGDGTTNVNSLKFFNANIEERLAAIEDVLTKEGYNLVLFKNENQ